MSDRRILMLENNLNEARTLISVLQGKVARQREDVMDAGIHAEMTVLIQQENELEEEKATLTKDIALWEKRVGLALGKNMDELADEAGFDLVAFGPADPGPDAARFGAWLDAGRADDAADGYV